MNIEKGFCNGTKLKRINNKKFTIYREKLSGNHKGEIVIVHLKINLKDKFLRN